MFREHLENKRLIAKLAWLDLSKTYKGSLFGWLWAIIRPVTIIFIYWFAFSIGLRVDNSNEDYSWFLWLVVGIVPWFYMSEILVGGANSLRAYKFIFSKLKFPISTVITFVNLSKLYVHLLLVAITLVIVQLSYGLTIYSLQLLIYIPLMFVFFNLISWALAPLSAYSKDVYQLVRAMTVPLFWLSGVIWPITNIENPILIKLFHMNPITFFTTGFRDALVDRVWIWDNPERLMWFSITYAITIFLGLFIFKKVSKNVVDVI